jgi:hypothetical protein
MMRERVKLVNFPFCEQAKGYFKNTGKRLETLLFKMFLQQNERIERGVCFVCLLFFYFLLSLLPNQFLPFLARFCF